MFSADLQSVLSCALLATLLIAVRHDVLEHRIPNVLCAVALLSGCAIHAFATGLAGLGFALGGAAMGLGVFLPLYLLRGMGAGDVKLMCAVGSFLGPLDTFFAAALALALGGLIGVTLVGVTFVRRARARNSELTASPASPVGKATFPYAAAIAGGAIFLMWHEGQFMFLTTMLAG
jgi:prepilin peptidase CpaA